MATYHAQLQVTYVKIHTDKSYEEVMNYLLEHYDEPVVYLWDIADYPDDPISHVADFEITI